MTRTILFYGDSATRGYGVGRDLRFAALIANDIRARATSEWQFSVGASSSDFSPYRKRLIVELERSRPEVLVCQCPVGPACYLPKFPAWVRAAMTVRHRFFKRLRKRYMTAEMRTDDTRTDHESMYEGRWLSQLYGWQPSNWPLVGPLWRARVRRYPTIATVDLEGYVKRMLRLREEARTRGTRKTLFIGLIPVAEDICPGYLSRAPLWCAALRTALDEPGDHSRFVDVFAPLLEQGLDRMLLKDRIHLTAEGHRLAASLIGPVLEPLLVT